MLEKDFYQYCENSLSKLFDDLEAMDPDSKLDVDYSDGILKIITSTNQTYVINRNLGNKKIWYSSPLTGADYFAFNQDKTSWENAQGEELSHKLFSEIKKFL